MAAGATIEDLKLMRAHSPAHVQVKAAGGVRDLDKLLEVRPRCDTRRRQPNRRHPRGMQAPAWAVKGRCQVSGARVAASAGPQPVQGAPQKHEAADSEDTTTCTVGVLKADPPRRDSWTLKADPPWQDG